VWLAATGGGSVTLTGSNSYTVGTYIENGTLVAGNTHAFGTGDVLVAGGTLDLNGNVIGNNITLAGGTLTNTGSDNIGVNNLYLGTDSSATVVNGGGKNLTVNGTLSGSGVITANSVTAATLAPGNSPGLDAVTGTLVLSNGQNYNWQVLNVYANGNVGTAGTDYDSVTVTVLDLTGLTNVGGYTINVQSLSSITGPGDVQGQANGWDAKKNYSWTLFDYGTLTGTFNANLFTVNPANFEGADPSATWSVTNTSGSIMLNYMVPEPGTLGLLAIGALALLGRRRRK
jgi:autotransporter-associated beta strand protein